MIGWMHERARAWKLRAAQRAYAPDGIGAAASQASFDVVRGHADVGISSSGAPTARGGRRRSTRIEEARAGVVLRKYKVVRKMCHSVAFCSSRGHR